MTRRYVALTDPGADGVVFPSAARTATPTAADLINEGWRGVHLVIDVTAVTSTPSVVFTIQGFDTLSGKAYDVLASAAVTATGTTVLKVFPSATASANAAANDCLPAQWRVKAVHGNANSITYTVAANYLR